MKICSMNSIPVVEQTESFEAELRKAAMKMINSSVGIIVIELRSIPCQWTSAGCIWEASISDIPFPNLKETRKELIEYVVHWCKKYNVPVKLIDNTENEKKHFLQ